MEPCLQATYVVWIRLGASHTSVFKAPNDLAEYNLNPLIIKNVRILQLDSPLCYKLKHYVTLHMNIALISAEYTHPIGTLGRAFVLEERVQNRPLCEKSSHFPTFFVGDLIKLHRG